MFCVACLKETDKLTCSRSCAARLARSVRLANELRDRFDNPEKKKVRNLLIKRLKFNKDINILDFWGGGLFADAVLDHGAGVKNRSNNVHIYELEYNKDLHPALFKYAKTKNQVRSVKNHRTLVHPLPGLLVDSLPQVDKFDLVWLDYCKTISAVEVENDLKAVRPYIKKNGILALTAFVFSGNKKDPQNGNTALVKDRVSQVIGGCELLDSVFYHKRMATYIFKKVADDRPVFYGVVNKNIKNYARILA